MMRKILAIGFCALIFNNSIFSVTPAEKKLLDAAQEGDFRQVVKLLDGGVNINVESWRSTIERAVMNGHEYIIEILLERKANLPQDYYLRDAIAGGRDRIAFMLIDAGMKINVDALHAAVKTGGFYLVSRLLGVAKDRKQLPALINTPEESLGQTALHVAASYPHTYSIIPLLLEHGAKKDVHDKGEGGGNIARDYIGASLKWQIHLDGIKNTRAEHRMLIKALREMLAPEAHKVALRKRPSRRARRS